MTDAKLTNERVYGEGLTVWRQDDGRVWFSTPHIQNQHLLTVEEVADLVRWLAGEPSTSRPMTVGELPVSELGKLIEEAVHPTSAYTGPR